MAGQPRTRPGRHAARLLLATVVGVAALLVAVSPGAGDSGEGVVAATSKIQRLVSLGMQHTCAITDEGTVECWGDNALGQLGTGDTATSTEPRLVSGISGAVEVASGNAHSCALIHGGAVKCWGLNASGQLGDSDPAYDNSDEPVSVIGIGRAVHLVSGDFHSCALVVGGAVYCWGQDGMGQLGDGDPGDFTNTPVEVQGLDPADPVVDLTAGEWHSCARTTAGKLMCWGHNGFGQLGDGTKDNRSTATAVLDPEGLSDASLGGPLVNVLAQSGGAAHTCAVLDRPSRPVVCWGQNAYGQLGHGTTVTDSVMQPSVEPLRVQEDGNPNELFETDVLMDNPAKSVTAGAFHTCALVDGGQVFCWGQNGHAQLGYDFRPLTPDRLEDSRWARPVPGVTAAGVIAGGFHTCAVTGPDISCWGYDFQGQLGGHDDQVESPTTVTAVQGARKVAVGTRFACALLTQDFEDPDPNTRPYCWGDNANGRLGTSAVPTTDWTTVRQPVDGFGPSLIPQATDLRAGNGSACVLPQGTGRRCWGLNASGELGDGTTTDRTSPVPSAHLASATEYDLGGTFVGSERGTTCKVDGGQAKCWGYNGQGQLGDGTTTDSALPITPVTVLYDANEDDEDADEADPQPLTGVTAVATGGDHACAIVGGGQVRCWGANNHGQLGDNTDDARQYAVRVQEDDDDDPDEVDPLDDVVALVAGDSHTCALLGDGKVRCWGLNDSGQLGRAGDAKEAEKPTRWIAPIAGETDLGEVTRLVSGDDHTCALRSDEALVCWGENGENQVGAGSGDQTRGVVVLQAPDPDDGDIPEPWIQDLAAGRLNTCVVLLDRTVSCWGDNERGQVGDGIGTHSLAPVVVGGDESFATNEIPLPPHLTVETEPGVATDPVVIPLATIDPDTQPSATTLTAVDDPPFGSVVFDSDSVVYTPDDDTCRDDSFAYHVTDGAATVAGEITVLMNCPPSPLPDTATVAEDGTVDIDVLANDTDEDGDTLTLSDIPVEPVNGTASIVAGQVRYEPNPDFCSPPTDTFTYEVDDAHGNVATAAVTVTVSCGNDGPVPGTDVVSTDEETELVVHVLDNDADADDDDLTVVSVGSPSHGTTTTNGSTVRYLPTADYCGDDEFTYVVSDGAVQATGTVDVSVTCAGDSPRASADEVSTPEDTSTLVNVLANDTDPDPTDTVSLEGTIGTPQHGTAVEEAGKIRYTPALDYCGLDSFSYVVTDGALTDTAQVTVHVTCVNDAPVAAPDAATTPEDTAVHIHVTGNDVDVDGDALTVTAISDPAYGTTAGAINNAVVYTPDPNFCSPPTDTFTYDAVDPSGETSTTTVTVLVTCVDDPVKLAPVADSSTPWGEPISVPLVATDIDGAPTLSIVTGPAGASIVGSSLTWTPASTQVGLHTITVRASEGGVSADRTFRVTVNKRATTLTYDGSVSGQVSDPAPVSATLKDALTGNPVLGARQVRFTLNGTTVNGLTSAGTGQATTLMPVAAPLGARPMQSAFLGDAAYTSSSASSTFTVQPEDAQVKLAGTPHVTTTGSQATVTYVAELTELDASPAGALPGTAVTFRRVDGTAAGTVICTATATETTAGKARASCTASQPVGAVPVLVTATRASYVIPADVGVATVANTGTGFASGAGRVVGDAFGFQVRPVKRAAPQGNLVHVVLSGGTATVVPSASVSVLTTTCTKAKVCSAHVEGTSSRYWTVTLATGATTETIAATTMTIDGVDPNRYGVTLTGGVARSIGPPSPVIDAGAVKVTP